VSRGLVLFLFLSGKEPLDPSPSALRGERGAVVTALDRSFLTGKVEQMALDAEKLRRPLIVADVHRHQTLSVERSPADHERHYHRHCNDNRRR